jgi:hypothetical protein
MAVLNQNLSRAFDLFELTPANEISFLDSYRKTLSKCCVDPLRPPHFSGTGLLGATASFPKRVYRDVVPNRALFNRLQERA